MLIGAPLSAMLLLGLTCRLAKRFLVRALRLALKLVGITGGRAEASSRQAATAARLRGRSGSAGKRRASAVWSFLDTAGLGGSAKKLHKPPPPPAYKDPIHMV